MAFELTPASVSEQLTLRAMIRATFAETPELAERCKDFSADPVQLESAGSRLILLSEPELERVPSGWQRST